MYSYQLLWLSYTFLGVIIIFALSYLFSVLTNNNTYKKKTKV